MYDFVLQSDLLSVASDFVQVVLIGWFEYSFDHMSEVRSTTTFCGQY